MMIVAESLAAMATPQEEDGSKDTFRKACVDFLLQEKYFLTAFELLHELQEDGFVESAMKLQLFFANSDLFPPEELAKMHAFPEINAIQLSNERDLAVRNGAMCEYDLQLAREDIKILQEKLAKQSEVAANLPTPKKLTDVDRDFETLVTNIGSSTVFRTLDEKERLHMNCAVKEYLMSAGYKIAAMTLQEEVDHNLDDWPNTTAHVSDALCHYYRAFLASTVEAMQDKDMLQMDQDLLRKEKEMLEEEKLSLARAVECSRKSAKEREKQAQQMKNSMELSTRQLNEYRAEVTSLKMELESLMAGRACVTTQKLASETQFDQISSEAGSELDLESELELGTPHSLISGVGEKKEDPCVAVIGTNDESSFVEESTSVVDSNGFRTPDEEQASMEDMVSFEDLNNHVGLKDLEGRNELELGTVQILADALPKIVPYVLINHREELLPLIMCAIERHPDSSVRDSLTHLLFNLIKRPDEEQRRIIMNACVELSKNVGQLRTETELLPQCWEQIDHKYEERRLLVAQSCGELGQLVGLEMRTSLILSIIQQLVGDQASVVRKAAAHNLAILLPLFSNMDNYYKVEELMFQLICDPISSVVDTSLEELVSALVEWIKREKQTLTHLYRGLLSRLIMAVQRCPRMSGVEDTADAQLRILGERERWSIDVLLRLLTQLLPEVQEAAFETCPLFNKVTDAKCDSSFLNEDVIKAYTGSNMEWPAFDWLVEDFFPALLQLARMLPPQEEGLRTRICKVILRINEFFGSSYLKFVVLPIFSSASGDDVDYSHMSSKFAICIKGLKPRSTMEERLAIMCVLPLLLAAVYGAPNMRNGELAFYLRDLILQSSLKIGALTRTVELLDSIHFLCTFEQHHTVIVGVLWELIVNPTPAVRVSAAALSKALVRNVELKSATQQIIPALVTLGSDSDMEVKHATIDAFGAVAQCFKDGEVVDKVKMQMDAFLEDGSHEATIAVVRSLSLAIPLTTSSLQDYLLNKLILLSGAPSPSSMLRQRRERTNVLCEAVRALDAIDLLPTSVSNLLVPTIQNLLKDVEAMDPAHKEALEGILKDQGGLRYTEVLSKAVGNSMGSFFGEGGYLRDPIYTNRASSESPVIETPKPPQEERGLKLMMRMSWKKS